MSKSPQYHSRPYSDIGLKSLRGVRGPDSSGQGEAAAPGDCLLSGDRVVVGFDPVERRTEGADPRAADLRPVGAVTVLFVLDRYRDFDAVRTVGDHSPENRVARCEQQARNLDRREGRRQHADRLRLRIEHRVDARRLRGHDSNRLAAEAVAEEKERRNKGYFEDSFHHASNLIALILFFQPLRKRTCVGFFWTMFSTNFSRAA